MKFYKYWAKASDEALSSGQPWKIERYGASNSSMADAQARARELARNTADIVRGGELPGGYLYSDRPVREEIIESFGEESHPYAVITRNAYGCLVLNTAQVLFADVDDPQDETDGANPLKPWLGMIGSFLGAPELAGEILGEEDSGDVPTRVAEFVEKSPGLGLRLYRTAAGYRCLVTSAEYDPLSPETQKLLVNFESDPLYIKLCQVQECFRARLTPKFWRCGLQGPTVRFPWANAAQEQTMRDWEQRYTREIRDFATCQFIESLGAPEIESQIAPIVELHDRLCCHEGKPLA